MFMIRQVGPSLNFDTNVCTPPYCARHPAVSGQFLLSLSSHAGATPACLSGATLFASNKGQDTKASTLRLQLCFRRFKSYLFGASLRPFSSAVTSQRLIIARSLVQIQEGPPLRILRLTVRTSPFHGENTGSNPVGFTNLGVWWNWQTRQIQVLVIKHRESSSLSTPTNLFCLPQKVHLL